MTRYLLGLILVLAVCLVALEWNADESGWAFFDTGDDLESEIELQPLHRDKDEVPMQLPTPPEQQTVQNEEELRVVEDEVETEIAPEQLAPPSEEAAQEETQEEEEKPQAVDMYDEPQDLRVVEDLPQFPGGAVAFMKWLTKHLKYPASAQKRKVQGRVVTQFIVNTDGSVSDLQVVEKLDPQCDAEALRVLRMMPKWQPGVMDAKPCRTKVTIPIVFKL